MEKMNDEISVKGGVSSLGGSISINYWCTFSIAQCIPAWYFMSPVD